jgi:manganese transport protein
MVSRAGTTAGTRGVRAFGGGGTKARRIFASIGPGFLVSVGYMDPGNWATNIAAGARFNYSLLWVLLASNLMALFLQSLSAKLGIVTGRSLAEACRAHLPRPVALGLWVTAEAACMATDLAEVLGAALGLYILFNIPLFPGALLTGLLVMLILVLQRRGHRGLEGLIFGIVAVIGAAFVFELYLAEPAWSLVAYHTVVPRLTGDSLLVAVGMLGATVMPHNLFLHSGVVTTRRATGAEPRALLRFAVFDTVLALNIAFCINAAMVVMSAAVFFSAGADIESIEQAHRTLTPILGGASALAFAVALLCAGLSSSVTGTLAGQIVMEGFLKIRMSLVLRRAVTLLPALFIIALGFDPLKALVVSQVALSLQLPFTIIPLIVLTGRRDVMGEFANGRGTAAVACAVAAAIILLNAWLLKEVFFGAG